MNLPPATSATPLPESERDRLGSIALDQWRGLALVLVLISHGFFFTNRVNGLGRVGVNLFFFISGILVFRSLSRTRAKTNWERSLSFWWRRLRRLYPAMITYTLAMLPVVWLLQQRPGLPPDSDVGSFVKAVPVAVSYSVNYLETPMSIGHMWSLACEMQFYLLAPIIYLLGGATMGRRNLVFGAILLILLGLGLAQPFIGKWKYHFEFAVWPMMLGFCCEYKRAWFQKIPDRFVSLLLWSSVAICGASIALMLFGMEMKPVVVATGALLLAPCLMAYQFGRPMTGPAGAAAKWMGQRTYSIYLWQQPFTLCNFLPQVWHPVGAAISVAVGGLWFHLFERPYLSGGRRESGANPAIATKSPSINRLVTAAILLLAAIYVSFSFIRTRYENQLRSQIWPASVPEVVAATNRNATNAPTVLLLGDSRMAQWGLPELHHWRVVNGGLGGFTTAQVRASMAKLLDAYHPDAIVLQVGINDLKFLGLQPGQTAQMVSLVLSNIVTISSECEKRHCKTLLLETWPAGEPDLARRLVWSDAISLSVNQLDAQLQALDKPAKGIHVVDLFNAAGLQLSAALYRDTLHFTPETYAKLTPILEKELDSVAIPAK